MPANKYALLRYRIIDRCLSNKARPYPNKEDLREACEETLYGSIGEHISISTIEKDIWAMRNESELGFYAPIAYSRDYGGYYYTEEDYTIQDISLSDEEFQAIHLAAQTLNQFREIDIFKEYNSAIDKIINRLNIQPLEDGNQPVIQFETAPGTAGQQFLNDLISAIESKRIVELEYQKFGNSETRQYQVAPYLLKEYRNRWYLIGKDLSKNAIVTYGLDRIRKLLVSEEKFAKDTGFSPDRFFKYSIGITQTDANPEKILLHTSIRQAQYLESQPLHQSQQIVHHDKYCEVALEVLPTFELVNYILSWGEEITVVEPPSLKKQIAEAHRKALDKYSS